MELGVTSEIDPLANPPSQSPKPIPMRGHRHGVPGCPFAADFGSDDHSWIIRCLRRERITLEPVRKQGCVQSSQQIAIYTSEHE